MIVNCGVGGAPISKQHRTQAAYLYYRLNVEREDEDVRRSSVYCSAPTNSLACISLMQNWANGLARCPELGECVIT